MDRPARVLLVGAGGLGSAAAIALARGLPRATVTVMDADHVEPSNLHRQVLHETADVGRAKATSAAAALRRLAPRWDVIAVRDRLRPDNALAALAGIDLVLDGSDGFATKFLVNDACVHAGVPFVHAAAVRWMGQLLAVDPRPAGGNPDPCYRCLFEAPPPAGADERCAEAGVVGPVVGVVGALQAEAGLALLAGRSVGGRLVVYDGLAGASRTVRFRRNPACAACGAERRHALDPLAYAEEPCASR